LRNQIVAYICNHLVANTIITMITRRDVFQAIADPTRRDIINLVTHQALTPNALAESFEVSRQAISKHLQILTECGLIVVKQQGRERYYEARLDRLKDVAHWIEQQQQVWTARFDRIDKLLKAEGKKAGRRK
jgi:DNA-binding transcriptional ArsR family regulator